MSHIELHHHGVVAAVACDAQILKLALIAAGKSRIILDDEQLRWLVETAGPALLDALEDA